MIKNKCTVTGQSNLAFHVVFLKNCYHWKARLWIEDSKTTTAHIHIHVYFVPDFIFAIEHRSIGEGRKHCY